MKVSVDVKKAFSFALKGIHVVRFETGEQEIPEEAAEYAVESKLAVKIKAAPSKDEAKAKKEAEAKTKKELEDLMAKAKDLKIEGFDKMSKEGLEKAIKGAEEKK